MRKYSSKVEELRKELCDVIDKTVKGKLAELGLADMSNTIDGKRDVLLDDHVHIFKNSFYEEACVDIIRVYEDGDIILCDLDENNEDKLNEANTDVLAEVADMVLNGEFECDESKW
jgi:hypothetical protein